MHKKQNGFSLIEMTIALLIIGTLLSVIFKAAPIMESVQLKATVKEVESYRLAAELFLEKYGSLPGDYRKAKENIAPYLKNGNGNGVLEGEGLDGHSEAFWFWQHLGAAGFIAHPGKNTSHTQATFGHGAPKAKIGGGFTVIHHPHTLIPMPGLWLRLGQQNGPTNDHALLTPSQAKYILDLCGEADPLHGQTRILPGTNVPASQCLEGGHLNLNTKHPACIAYFKL